MRLTGVALLLAATSLILAPHAKAQAVLACATPAGERDRLVVARASGSATRLELWQITPRRLIATRRYPKTLTALVRGHRALLLQSAHALALAPADLHANPRTLWSTALTILRSAPFRNGWLVLACNGTRGGHPWAGQVWYLHASPRSPLRLSLLPRYNFWDLQVGDVDGDGRPEIALCTWSMTRRIRKYARRYFVYGWDGSDVYPRWRGSRLSRPYVQARLVRLLGIRGDALLAVEITRSGRRCLTAYRWEDFGFTGLAESAEMDAATIIDSANGWMQPQGHRGTEAGWETTAVGGVGDVGEVDGALAGPTRYTLPRKPSPLAPNAQSSTPLLVRIRVRSAEWLCAVERQQERLTLRRICQLAAGDVIVPGRFTATRASQVLVIRSGRANRARLYTVPAAHAPTRSAQP